MSKANSFLKYLALAVFTASVAPPLAVLAENSVKGETAGQYVDDATITAKVKSAILADPQLKVMDIGVKTNKGAVELNGSVDSTQQKTRAVKLAQGVSGVQSVEDNLTVRGREEQ